MASASKRLTRVGPLVVLPIVMLSLPVGAQDTPPAEPDPAWPITAVDYSNVEYPYPVDYLDVEVYGDTYRMAYMDVAPTGTPNGQTVVLFHGMNFFAAVFETTIEALSEAGFRAIAVDRLGFGRSSKPDFHYNHHIPARNTKRLLDHLALDQVAVIGHSMGGVIATRFTSTYPEHVSHVIMANQIGLTDGRHGNEWRDSSERLAGAMQTSYQSVLRGHRRYYHGTWKNEYLKWVKVQYGLTLSGDWPRMAKVRAALGATLYEDPVVHEWQYIENKALVIGGELDGLVDDYPARARHVAEELQNAELFIFPGIGHNPVFEIPDRYHAELIRFLRSDPTEPADQSWVNTDVGVRP